MRSGRSLVDVLDDIFGNLQDIVRSEIRLARAEIGEEFSAAKTAALGLGFALLAGAFSLLFGLFSVMYALSLVMARWSAALVIAAAMAALSLASFLYARRRAGRRRTTIPRTAANIKEGVEWASQSTR